MNAASLTMAIEALSVRNTIFEARDAIFDIATEGSVEWGSSEYREIRDSLNSLIRFAHRISWPALLWINLTLTSKSEEPSIDRAIHRIQDRETRLRINKQVNKASKAVLLLLFCRSPILCLLLMPFYALRLVTHSLDASAYRVAKRIQSKAECYEGEQLGIRKFLKAAH